MLVTLPEDGGLSQQIMNDLLRFQGVEIVRLRAELLEAKNETDSRKDCLHQASEIGALRQELRELRARVDECGSRITEHPERNAINDELGVIRKENDGLRDQNAASEHALVAALEEHARYVTDVEKKYAVLEADKDELRGLSKRAAEDVKLLAERLQTMEEAVKTAQDAQEKCVQELSEKKMQNEALEQQISDLRSTRKSNRWLLHSTRWDLENTKASEASLSAELTLARDELIECQSELNMTKTSEQMLRAQLLELEVRLELLAEDVSVECPDRRTSADANEVYGACEDRSKEDGSGTGPIGMVGGSIEDTFIPFASQQPDFEVVKAALGIRSIWVTTQNDLVWTICPETAYLVKPARELKKKETWASCKNKVVKRLQGHGRNELVSHISGAYYYLGTYTVGEAENLSLEEFERLPDKVRQVLVSASGRKCMHGVLREMWYSGKLTALKFPVRRVGWNSKLAAHLRDASRFD